MTSKTKIKCHQINANSNLDSKINEGTSKGKSSALENLFQSNNIKSKNGKLISNIDLNLNLNKNFNLNNVINTNNYSNANNFSNNQNNNTNNNNNPNSNSFRQVGIVTKKYKTSKNSRNI